MNEIEKWRAVLALDQRKAATGGAPLPPDVEAEVRRLARLIAPARRLEEYHRLRKHFEKHARLPDEVCPEAPAPR